MKLTLLGLFLLVALTTWVTADEDDIHQVDLTDPYYYQKWVRFLTHRKLGAKFSVLDEATKYVYSHYRNGTLEKILTACYWNDKHHPHQAGRHYLTNVTVNYTDDKLKHKLEIEFTGGFYGPTFKKAHSLPV